MPGNHQYFTQFQDEATCSTELTPERLWFYSGATGYQLGGGRDVLVILADLPPQQPEAVPRRPGQLTEEYKQKLQSQGLTGDFKSEADVMMARRTLDKRYHLAGVKSGHSLSREDVSKSITHLFNTTKNDGGMEVYLHVPVSIYII